jgi:hypothetical protein
MEDTKGTPEWITELAGRVREVKLPTAQLADAMRDRGEDPRDEALWAVRIGQLDKVLFGGPLSGPRGDVRP